MKIFNNFDSKIKETEYSYALEKHGNANVILIQRTFAYWMVNGILPLIVFIFFATIFIYFDYKYIQQLEFVGISSLVFLFIIVVFMLRYLVNTYLEYKYDFTIVTKEGISSYKQIGFFQSKNKDLPAQNIRSIQSERCGLLGNIFGYGKIDIITDGSITDMTEEGTHLGGKMSMTYVKHPIISRKEIIEVCLMDRIKK